MSHLTHNSAHSALYQRNKEKSLNLLVGNRKALVVFDSIPCRKLSPRWAHLGHMELDIHLTSEV